MAAIGDVLRTIDASFVQPLNLDTLAPVAGLSVSRFRGEIGLSPYRYLGLVRVRRVQGLLRGSVALSDVATESGFFDQSPQCRHFWRVPRIMLRDYVSGRSGGTPRRTSSTRTRAELRDACCHAA
ncbi:AraC family transcriptional regulator [Burkholderia sp. GS2Y]|uniref:AraC family transcriptional regulator n=1 Tax=Burkholderia theae TaxID=3143496 RepID=A0ABU9WJ95_9BURK